MSDIENSLANLQDASTSGVGHYCFYLEDPVPFNPSYFYWYSSLNSLFDALRDDLFAILFHDDDDEFIPQFLEEIGHIVSEFRLKRTPVFFELTKRINDVWQEYENSSLMNFCYLGTYDNLCTGNDSFERSIRNKFRNGPHSGDRQKAGPIKETELEDFNDFLSGDQ
jgi:hypothetical protein